MSKKDEDFDDIVNAGRKLRNTVIGMAIGGVLLGVAAFYCFLLCLEHFGII